MGLAVTANALDSGTTTLTGTPLDEGGAKTERSYKLFGKRLLSEDDWTELPGGTDVDAGGWRFFRVGVGMPE